MISSERFNIQSVHIQLWNTVGRYNLVYIYVHHIHSYTLSMNNIMLE